MAVVVQSNPIEGSRKETESKKPEWERHELYTWNLQNRDANALIAAAQPTTNPLQPPLAVASGLSSKHHCFTNSLYTESESSTSLSCLCSSLFHAFTPPPPGNPDHLSTEEWSLGDVRKVRVGEPVVGAGESSECGGGDGRG